MKFLAAEEDNDEINLTPLIDVVFLLLIFFMLTTTFKQETTLSIDLPEVSSLAQEDRLISIEVLIDKEGRYAVNNQVLQNHSATALREHLKALRSENGNLNVVIRADAQSSHQSLMSLLDAAAAVGLLNISIAADTKALEAIK